LIPAELAEIYARVAYWVTPAGAQPYVLRVGAACAELDAALALRGVEEWAYLTAHNPLSEEVTPEANARAQAALEAELREAGYEVLPGYGEGLEGWPDEASLLVFGIGPEAAGELARRYRQAAFLLGRAGEPVRLAAGLAS